MSGFHGMFSAGGMVGAGFGALALQAGMTPLHHLWLSCAVCLLLGCWGASQVQSGCEGDGGAASFTVGGGALAFMGVLAALGLLCEGAMYDWSVLYLRQEHGAAPGQAAWAYASFSGAMAAGRFGGDWVGRLDAGVLLRGSALLAACGMGGGVGGTGCVLGPDRLCPCRAGAGQCRSFAVRGRRPRARRESGPRNRGRVGHGLPRDDGRACPHRCGGSGVQPEGGLGAGRAVRADSGRRLPPCPRWALSRWELA